MRIRFTQMLIRRQTLQHIRSSSSTRSSDVASNLPRRIIFGSCSSQTEDLIYWKTISSLRPDRVLLLGDNVYGGKNHIEGLREAYDALLKDAHFQIASKSVGIGNILATLDDNDYGNAGDACSQNPFKEEAKQLFLDVFDIYDERRAPGRGVYKVYQWSHRLQILLLDLRYDKTPFRYCDDHLHFLEDSNPDNTMMGANQWAWLEEQLKVPVQLRLLASPLQVLALGHSFECWRLFPHERERLLDRIHQSFGTTMILSGDRHFGAYYEDNVTSVVEITSSSLTHSVPKGLLDDEKDPLRVGDIVYRNNFGVLDCDWDSGKLTTSLRIAETGDILRTYAIDF
jgi:alkaline phosphatase D